MENWMHRLLVAGSALALTLGMALATSPTASAYGVENYQIGFAGTAVAPGTGSGFGFWGWCAFGGGTTFSSGLATSGTTGDCNYALYVHTSSGGGVTCEQSVDVTSWTIKQGSVVPVPTFFVAGTATVKPSSATVCFALFPGVFPATFPNFDTLIPAAPAHYHLNGVLGLTGEFQIQVTAIP